MHPHIPTAPYPSSRSDSSPTYDLLDQYSDHVHRPPAPSDLVPALDVDQQAMWIKITATHDDLLAKRGKASSDEKLTQMRDRSDAMGSTSRFLLGDSSSSGPTTTQYITTNTNTFFDKTPSLLKALDKVGQIHPFAGAAILAFRAVYELEIKRRENDKKILAVYGDMRDMMAALAQLRAIKASDECGPDGLSIQSRLATLVDRTAHDIQHCANTCDTYLKKRLVVRLITGAKWEHVLARFAALFHGRRGEFEFALSVHTGRGVDQANDKLDALGHAARRMEHRMDAMMAFFQTTTPVEHREMATRVREQGGVHGLLENERLLREVVEFARAAEGDAADGGMAVVRGRGLGVDVDELRVEIREEVEGAVERNAETFARKFEMQRKQIVDELSRVVHREGDRIIDAITAGPHDRIIDPDLHAIWKEMGWRGSTKARHFVLALRDYFRERMEEQKRSDKYEAPRIQEQDEWALDWINVTRMQPIVEAFDDDASNFITVTEANDFTTARPRHWSLLHWLAYWAIGWQVAATMYRDKINHIFAKMFSLKSHIHPAVRTSVDTYLHTVWTPISELMASIDPYYPSDTLREKFQSYIESEEQRLREGLQTVKFDIDAMDTLVLVTGPGRIEKYVFPILYLLLEKDYEVMRLARANVISKDELWDAADTIGWVLQAVDFRYKDLQDIFRQQKLDARQQFRGFACGLFEHWHNSDGLWSRTAEFQDHVYNDGDESQNVSLDILNYPLDNGDLFDPSGYDIPPFSATQQDIESRWPLRAILGPWSGFLSKGDVYPCQPMLTLHVHALDSRRFEAHSRTPNGTAYTLTGEYGSEPGGHVFYTFVVKYAARFDPLYFRGCLYDGGETFAGAWGSTPEACLDVANGYGERSPQGSQSTLVMDPTSADRFVFKRLLPSVMCCRPDPVEFQMNKPRALWKYATTAIREVVGRQLFTWSYFQRRRDHRKRYVELLIRLNFADLDEDERMELARIRQTLTAADARLYETRYDYELRTTPIHLDVACDHCGSTIIGPRVVCLDCDSSKPLNLCDDPRCKDSEIDIEKRADLAAPHLAAHAVFKARTMIHLREFGKMDRAARAALKKGRMAFADAADLLIEEHGRNRRSLLARSPETARSGPDRASRLMQGRLSCIVCKQRVSKPCWYCISCEDDVFVCTECDAKGALTIGTHSRLHPLVRCQDEARFGPLDVDQRLAGLEERFADMEGRFGAMEGRFGAMEGRFGAMEGRFEALEVRIGTMDEKMTRIEKMLEAMWTRSRKLASSRRAQSVTVGSSASAYPPRPLPPSPPRGWELAESP